MIDHGLPRIQNNLTGILNQLLQRQMDSTLQLLGVEVNFEVGFGMPRPESIVIRQRIWISRLMYVCCSLLGYRLGRRTNGHGGKSATGRVRDECSAMLSKSNLGKPECAAEAEDCSHSASDWALKLHTSSLCTISDEIFEFAALPLCSENEFGYETFGSTSPIRVRRYDAHNHVTARWYP